MTKNKHDSATGKTRTSTRAKRRRTTGPKRRKPIGAKRRRSTGAKKPDGVRSHEATRSESTPAPLSASVQKIDEEQPQQARRPESQPVPVPAGAERKETDETRLVIALAGIEDTVARRRRSALLLGGAGVLLVATIALDLAGVIEIPGIGLRSRVGLAPQPEKPVAATGRTGALSAAERRRMRRNLLGGGNKRKRNRPKSGRGLSAAQRQVAADIFASGEKREVHLKTPEGGGRGPQHMPDGLSAEAVSGVIAENSSSAALCLAESMRRSTVPPGRMEIEITIHPSGKVSGARVGTRKYAGTQFASCVTRRIRSWRFPSFAGDAVTVVYPYIVSSEM